ncbi:60S ribosomal protein L10, partial [Blastocystis sp. subtype 4]|uniref:60S ribosomal protein L10 n=1 Tax=Blastocystis sp. subtype 4 TaxID=944170 RepID=UPI000711DE7A
MNQNRSTNESPKLILFIAFCSKVNSEILSKALDTLLDLKLQGKKRNFVETVELQVTLKQIDPAKDKRFSGSFQLPNPTRSHMDVCIFVNDKHEQICKKEGIPCMNVDEITNLNKNKKLIRKLAKKYDAFLAS